MLHLFFFLLYLVKSCRLKAAFAHLLTSVRANMFGILNPSGQISLIWAEKTNPSEIRRRRHITRACTGGSKEYKAETNEKHRRHSHFHKEIMEKCHEVRLSGQSSHPHTIDRVYYSPSLCLFRSLVWPFRR